jgi:hypothetical protein
MNEYRVFRDGNDLGTVRAATAAAAAVAADTLFPPPAAPSSIETDNAESPGGLKVRRVELWR